METECSFVLINLIVDFRFRELTNTCRYTAVKPSPEFSNARLINPLMLDLDFNCYVCAADLYDHKKEK